VVDPKRHGITSFNAEPRAAAQTLIDLLSQKGCFVVHVGELECWFPEAGSISRGKASFLPAVFEWMGSNPAARDYVRPPQGDRAGTVWEFFEKLAQWHFHA
jgi:hypothetical protein